jgi:hypothetical protein
MHRLLNNLSRRVAMLLIAVMLIVPVLDAFACALEPASGHWTEMVTDEAEDSPGERDDSEKPHGLCAHNHCHHTMGSVPSNEAVGLRVYQGGAHLAFQDDAHRSIVSDGPIEPPRI